MFFAPHRFLPTGSRLHFSLGGLARSDGSGAHSRSISEVLGVEG